MHDHVTHSAWVPRKSTFLCGGRLPHELAQPDWATILPQRKHHLSQLFASKLRSHVWLFMVIIASLLRCGHRTVRVDSASYVHVGVEMAATGRAPQAATGLAKLTNLVGWGIAAVSGTLFTQ